MFLVVSLIVCLGQGIDEGCISKPFSYVKHRHNNDTIKKKTILQQHYVKMIGITRKNRLINNFHLLKFL